MPWADFPRVRPFYSDDDIKEMVESGAIRVEGNQAFLLQNWAFTGKERQTFNELTRELRKLNWRVEAPARVPNLVAGAEARLTLPESLGGEAVYGEFFMPRKSSARLALAGGLAFHKATRQPFLLIPKDFDEIGVDPEKRHHWDLFVHGEHRGFETSLKDLAPVIARHLANREDASARQDYEPGLVAMHMDRPAQVDRLGRKAFAQALARRFRRIVQDQQSEAAVVRSFDSAFMVHLHAPWGAGKTSVLHLIAEDLATASAGARPWAVVKFNAWQHQRIDPPWWSLLDVVFRDSMRSFEHQPFRRVWLRIGEHARRLSAGYAHILVATAVGLWLITLALYFGLSRARGVPDFWSRAGNWAQSVAAVVALLAGLWAFISAISRSLLPGSAQAAQGFVRNTNDPMRAVSIHFKKFIGSLRRPAIVFVDDVDRCDRQFVVRLLEGIQTLFHDPRVIFVVAGDRRWINACYEGVYPEFVASIVEPGRRLGALFLEKAFQLSVSLPQLSPQRQQEYWNYLLHNVPEGAEAAREKAQARAQELLAGAESERQVLDQLSKGGEDPLLAQALREETVKRLADRDIEETSQHFLQRFAPLLELNPRSMKRLVNAYGVYRDMAILSHLDFESNDDGRKQLALWAIVSLRWPLLEELLVMAPDLADALANPPGDPAEFEKALLGHIPRIASKRAEETRLIDLMMSEPVLRVFNAPEVGAKLDAKAVRRLIVLPGTAGIGAAPVL
jgi:hypothetical protein